MKLQRHSKATLFRIAVFLALGIVGGCVFTANPFIGGILCCVGFAASLWSLFQSELKARYLQDQLDVHAHLLAKHGAGNVYLEIFRAELVKYGRCDRAVDYLAKAVHAEPDNPDASSQLAGVLALAISSLRSTGRDVPDAQLRFAKRIALRARELNPHNYSPYSALGILCDNEGKHEEARRWFAQARNKGDPVWQIEMCTSYGMEGRFEEALHEIEQVVAQGELFAWLVPYWHGKSLFAVGRYAEATPPLLLAFHLRGLRYDLMLSVSDSLYMQGRFLSSSLFHCLEALTLWPVNKKRSGRLLAEAVVHTLVFLLTRISRFAPPLTRHIKPVLKFQ